MVGSACTLVYERWKQAGLLGKMSQTSARVLICGILDNTLNFGATITGPRDHEAYKELLKIANLPEDWPAQYFNECQAMISSNLQDAITNDMKQMKFPSRDGDVQAGQLVIWDPTDLLQNHRPEIEAKMEGFGPVWFMNIVSVKEGKSHLLSKSAVMQQWLGELLGISFENGLAVADRMWLRKEMIKQDLSRSKS
jgi:inorganic pyrophosphatase/exopolyphosphatase